ncbi:N-acetylneuraminate synthase family protein [Megalodesulfovibrio paquesii]
MNHLPPPSILLPSGKMLGEGRPVFVVAEIGNNHQGELSLALELVEAAARAGVDAVKFQKRHTRALLTKAGCDAPYTGPNSFGSTYGAHRDALELGMDDMAALKARAEALGLSFLASAWDLVSLEAMLELGMDCVKVASADLVAVPMLRRIGRSGLPVLLSTGMSSLEQIDRAVAELRAWHDRIVLLHCNSSYPCPESELRLPVMRLLKTRYGLPVGYSGHELGLGPSVAAAALGACVVERHMTLDRAMRGTDHKASLAPGEFAALVRMIREVEQAMTGSGKVVTPSERETARKLRKSIVAARDLPAGHLLTEEDLACKSPGTGLLPEHWDEVVGSRLQCAVRRDQQLQWSMLRGETPWAMRAGAAAPGAE